MHVTTYEGNADSSALGVSLESFDEPIALSLAKSNKLKNHRQRENKDLVVLGRPMVVLQTTISTEQRRGESK